MSSSSFIRKQSIFCFGFSKDLMKNKTIFKIYNTDLFVFLIFFFPFLDAYLLHLFPNFSFIFLLSKGLYALKDIKDLKK